MPDWQLFLDKQSGPRYRAIVEALVAAIETGRVVDGARLPTQRELARLLGLSLGTVTKAYTEAERQGLVSGKIGRGTYIRARRTPREGRGEPPHVIDLGLNVAPPTGEDVIVRDTLQAILASADIARLLGYAPHQGRREHRESVARWLGTRGIAAAADNVILTPGAQHALFLTLGTVAQGGDVILTECLTYAGMAALAAHAGYRLHGVSMDREGILPVALDRAFRETGSRVLYCMPTFQTPTNALMSPERRDAVAAVLQSHDAYLVEDDVYGFLLPEPVRPIAAELPERAFYVTSFAKCAAPGLRVGAALVPPAFRERIAMALRATSWMAAPLMVETLTRLADDGGLSRLAALKRAEAGRRAAFARRLLSLDPGPRIPPSFHLWLPLSDPGAVPGLIARAGLKGVSIAPPIAVAPGQGERPGVRLCLGGPRSDEDFKYAIGVISDALSGEYSLATV